MKMSKREMIRRLQAELAVVRADLDWTMRLAMAETPEARKALIEEREERLKAERSIWESMEKMLFFGGQKPAPDPAPRFTGLGPVQDCEAKE